MTMVGNLDMQSNKDRALVRRTADDYLTRHPRWNITPEFRAKIMAALEAAHGQAIIDSNVEMLKDITDTVAKLDQMNIVCEQHADKMKRLDAGLNTENVGGVVRLTFDDAG